MASASRTAARACAWTAALSPSAARGLEAGGVDDDDASARDLDGLHDAIAREARDVVDESHGADRRSG